MSFQERQKGDFIYLTSDKIAFPHAFSTRLGGKSQGVFSSFNFAFGARVRDKEKNGEEVEVKDSLDAVRANRAIFAHALGGEDENVCTATQIHSKNVFVLEKAPECELFGDGFVTDRRNLILCVKTADCIPVLLCDADARVSSALHAGWRGTFADIVGEGIEKMISLGAKRENICAAIGPGICRGCFEVGDEVEDELRCTLGEDFMRFVYRKEGGKAHIDLKGLNRELLIASGVKAQNIDVCPECTCCQGEKYFSHRRMGAARGVMASGIMIP